MHNIDWNDFLVVAVLPILIIILIAIKFNKFNINNQNRILIEKIIFIMGILGVIIFILLGISGYVYYTTVDGSGMSWTESSIDTPGKIISIYTIYRFIKLIIGLIINIKQLNKDKLDKELFQENIKYLILNFMIYLVLLIVIYFVRKNAIYIPSNLTDF